MRPRFGTLTWIGISAVGLGALVAGCSNGGGGGGGSSAPPVAAVDPVGPLTSALPVVSRGANYTWSTYQVNNITGSGAVTALGVAPTGTETLAIDAPLNQVSRLANGTLFGEDSLAARSHSIATVGTVTVAATGDPSRSGVGDVYRRYAFNGFGNWQVTLDTSFNEAYVAAVGSKVAALVGGEDATGMLYMLDTVAGVGSFTATASLGDVIGTSIGQLDGVTYVGGMDNAMGGGAATLLRIVGAGAVAIDVPGAGGGGGVRQEISSMLTVPYASVAAPGSASEVLVMAVGAFDRNTGVGLSGMVVATDGTDFEVMHAFSGSAPTALAFADNTIYVSTSDGSLLYRESDGSWTDEPNLPVVTGIQSMLARDKSTLILGCSTESGAAILVRSGAGGAPPIGVPADYFYTPDVKNILQAKCAACHTSTAIVTAAQMQLSTGLTDDTGDYAQVTARIDTNDAANSLLLLKGTATVTHTGQAAIAVGSSEYNTLLKWIQQGAPMADTGGGGTQNFTTYVADVAPILAAAGCNSCHGAGSGRSFIMLNPADLNADFNEVRTVTDPVVPQNSQLLLHAAGQSHPVTLFGPGSTQSDTIIQWINDGRRFQ